MTVKKKTKRVVRHRAHTAGTKENASKRAMFESCINLMRQRFNDYFYKYCYSLDKYEDLFQETLLRCWQFFRLYDKRLGASHTTYLSNAANLAAWNIFMVKPKDKWEIEARVYDVADRDGNTYTGNVADHRRQGCEDVDVRDSFEAAKRAMGENDFRLVAWFLTGEELSPKPRRKSQQSAKPRLRKLRKVELHRRIRTLLSEATVSAA